MSGHYTDAEAKQVCLFMDDMRHHLGLPYYQLTLAAEEASKGCLATIQWGIQRYEATVNLGKDWTKQSEEEKRNSVVHEMVHLVHARVNTAVMRAKPNMHGYEYEAFWAAYNTEIELMVDQLSYMISADPAVKKMWKRAGKAAKE